MPVSVRVPLWRRVGAMAQTIDGVLGAQFTRLAASLGTPQP